MEKVILPSVESAMEDLYGRIYEFMLKRDGNFILPLNSSYHLIHCHELPFHFLKRVETKLMQTTS
jgi:hypothetical protein